MRKVKLGRRLIAEINVVPYIDVMLVLLIIFMVTVPLLSEGIKVSLPIAQGNNLSGSEPVIVSIDSKGRYFLNVGEQSSEALDEEALRQGVLKRLKSGQDLSLPVWIRGDTAVEYGHVIAAMALLQQVGVKSVSLITQPTS